jgi:hypothetical protein
MVLQINSQHQRPCLSIEPPNERRRSTKGLKDQTKGNETTMNDILNFPYTVHDGTLRLGASVGTSDGSFVRSFLTVFVLCVFCLFS